MPDALNSNPEENFHPTYRPDIDGLRAVAILSVVFFHAFPRTLRGGFVGVDIFFVISGFLISSIVFRSLHGGSFSFVEFYAHRIRRIFPALILVMISSLIFGWFALLPDELKQLGKHVAAGAGFVQNFVLLSEAGYFDNASELKPMMHLWSLAIEEQFYLAYPLIIWCAWKARLSVLLLVAVIALLSFLLNITNVSRDAVGTFFLPYTRIWELLAGALLAHIYLFRRAELMGHLANWVFRPSILGKRLRTVDRESLLNNLVSFLGLFLLVIAMIGIHKGQEFPGWRALAPVIGASLLVMSGPHAWVNRVLLSNKPVVFVGLISYPLYLWHWPILSFARIVESEILSVGFRATAVLLSFCLAWLTYQIIEKPIRLRLRQWKVAVALAFAMIIVGLSGYVIFLNDGYVYRNQLADAEEPSLSKYLGKLANNSKHISELETDRQSAIRAPYCHMNADDQTFWEFRKGIEACLQINENAKNVLVLGDSHAADFYVALKSISGNYNFLQATGAGCAPDIKSGRCLDFLNHMMEFTARTRLDAVFLAARWKPVSYERLSATIKKLKEQGHNVLLVGPPKTYLSDVHRFISRKRPGEKLDFLSVKFTDQENEKRNRDLRDFAEAHQIPYIDRISTFCNADGSCPLINDDGDLLTADYGHVLRIGAQYLGQRLAQSGVNF